ncbi:MAG: hypothetical protein WDO74_18930 [Pseudomonadota bacterium]
MRHPDDPNIQKIAPSIVERAKTELFELDLKCDEACDVTVAGKIRAGPPRHRAHDFPHLGDLCRARGLVRGSFLVQVGRGHQR